MFRNYFIVALRNIARHKLYSFINITGLAVGLACLMLIILFVRDELSYDKWIPGSADLYRVESTFHAPGRSDIVAAQAALPMPVAMRDQIPEVRAATRLALEQMTMSVGSRQFLEKVAVVDPNFLKVIRLPLVSGDPAAVLARPESVVISQSAAKKYFGDADPVGKTILTGRQPCAPDAAVCDNSLVPLRVTGVMRDLPHNTQLVADMLMPNTSIADRVSQAVKHNWLTTMNFFGYVVLAPGTDPATVLAKLKTIIDHSIDTSTTSSMRVPGSRILEPRLVRFQDAHLTTDRFGGMRPPGSRTTLYGLGVIGALIMLVACFNFMNLATARATLRAREISLRKCMGATRRQLIVQFLGEAVLMTLLAMVLALALVEVLLPPFGSFLQAPLSLHYLSDWPMMLGIVAIAVLAGLVGGIYPALVLSGFRPATVLRSNSSGNPGSGLLRTVLVVLQFAVSIGLGIAALVVYLQIDYARHIDLGFQRDNIVVTGTVGRLTVGGLQSFEEALRRGPGVLGVTRSSDIPFSGSNNSLSMQKPGDPQMLTPTHVAVMPNFFQLYGIKILAGRVLSISRGDDVFFEGAADFPKNENHNIMVNAALAHALGYAPADIIGQTFIIDKVHMKVVGVTADVLSDGVRTPVVHTIYVYAPDRAQTYSIRVQAGHAQDAMAYIERTSRSFVTNAVMQRVFLDDSYERLYRADKKQGEIFDVFVAIAIVIACMGLFGLAAFTAGRRTKEIGIRKVFGARTRDVILLLLWQFSIPVLVANLIAWPVAWYYLHGWLEGFALRISLSPLYFLGAGFAALVIAWATIFAHALRVARANPIRALRYE